MEYGVREQWKSSETSGEWLAHARTIHLTGFLINLTRLLFTHNITSMCWKVAVRTWKFRTSGSEALY